MMEMTQNDQVVAWIKQTVETHYPNDVELVLLYGSYVNNTANAYSDVDCYFVPATDRGWELSRTFIINGIGYDLFGMDRSRVEGIAALRSFLTPLVGDAVILSAKDPSARAWFESLQKQLVNALSNPEVIANRNIERYQNATATAMRMSKSTTLLRARFYAGQLIQELADIVALFNQTYFRHGLKTPMARFGTHATVAGTIFGAVYGPASCQATWRNQIIGKFFARIRACALRNAKARAHG
ncbi:MAG: nucleotidyltransferase domain-containing protein [Bacillus subtilis]|nr:nucleotidyltransferase domain-containing protein [Bacillus subtilis]